MIVSAFFRFRFRVRVIEMEKSDTLADSTVTFQFPDRDIGSFGPLETVVKIVHIGAK
jgi:hypothetical protein